MIKKRNQSKIYLYGTSEKYETRSYIMLYFENDYCEGAHEAILKD